MKTKSQHTLTTDFFKDLSSLLNQGYTLNDSLLLLKSFKYANQVDIILFHLNKGESFNEILSHFHTNKLFFEYYLFLNENFSISKSIDDAIKLASILETFKNILKKNLTYPVFLILVMVLFAYFMNGFVIPEISNLLLSFNVSNESMLLVILRIMPYMILVLILYIAYKAYYIYKAFVSLNKKMFNRILRNGLVKQVIQYYFSIKFSIYFGSVIDLNMGIKDCMDLLTQATKNSDLVLCMSDISQHLNQGSSLEESISGCPFFHSSFISYFNFISSSHQPLSGLLKYSDFTLQYLEEKLNYLMKGLMIGIYVFTGLFIVLIYWLMLFPIINVVSNM